MVSNEVSDTSNSRSALAEGDTGAPKPGARAPLGRGLSTKLLFLTVAFVLLAELLIFFPSAANFRLRWMQDKLNIAGVASVMLINSGPETLSRMVQDDILAATGAKVIAVREDGLSRLLVESDMPSEVDQHVDLDNPGNPLMLTVDALDTLVFGGDRMIRIHGSVGENMVKFEIIVPDRELHNELLIYSRNIALISLIISLITATLVFYAINRVMIRPIRAMTRSMLAFASRPDDAERIIKPEERDDEIGIAQRELSAMQAHLHKTLGEQKHLADLGLAVSKINHDMRNMLASAQLISDRLGTIKDPTVQAFAPKLMRTLDRAISYTQGVLAYGRTQEEAPSRRRIRLRALVDEVEGLLAVDRTAGIEFVNAVDEQAEIDADPEQLFRVLTNLCRNAAQAMAQDQDGSLVRTLTVTGRREGTVAYVQVVDTGPGLPEKARKNLFTPFRGSARSGGTGLGLAIAHELVRAHGGMIGLVESRGGRTVFEVSIPDQPVDLEKARGRILNKA